MRMSRLDRLSFCYFPQNRKSVKKAPHPQVTGQGAARPYQAGNQAGPGRSAALRRPSACQPESSWRQPGPYQVGDRARALGAAQLSGGTRIPAREQQGGSSALPCGGSGRPWAQRRPPADARIPAREQQGGSPGLAKREIGPALGTAQPSGGTSLPAREQPVTAWALPGERSGRPPWEQRSSPAAPACRSGSSR